MRCKPLVIIDVDFGASELDLLSFTAHNSAAPTESASCSHVGS
jgi:hypothetical protein